MQHAAETERRDIRDRQDDAGTTPRTAKPDNDQCPYIAIILLLFS